MLALPPVRPLLAAAALAISIFALGVAAQPPGPLQPPPNSPRRADPSLHAITGVTLHVSPTVTLPKATIILRNGLIEEASENAPVPPGAQVWPGEGLHVYAGFIEPYLEVDAPRPDAESKGSHWNARVTPQRDAMESKGVSEDAAKTLRSLGFAAAAIAPRGGIFRGTSAVVSLAKPDGDISQSRPPAYAEKVYQSLSLDTGGGDGGQERWPGYPDSQMGSIALIRQTFIDADWHAAELAAGREKNEPSCLDALDRKVPLLFNVDDDLEILRARKIAAEFKRPIITLGGGNEYQRLDAIATDKSPLIVPLNFPKKPKVDSIGEAEAVGLRELMAWEQAPTNLRRLDAAGLTIAITTAKLKDKGQFRDHLRQAIRHGLPEEHALAMLTTVPAKLLGVDAQLGKVEKGMRANLVVTDGPLFAKKTKLRDMWVDGKRHEINAAPSKLEGTYDIGLTPPPKSPGLIYWVIDKDNNLTIKKDIDAPPEKVEPKPEPKPEAKPEDKPAAPADAPAAAPSDKTPEAAEPKPQPPTDQPVRPTDAKPAEPRPADAAKPDPPAPVLPVPAPAEPKPPAKKTLESRAKSFVLAGNRLSFTFEHEVFGLPGVFTISGLVAPDSQSISGEGTRSDGGRFTWTATRRPPPPADKDEKADKPKEDDDEPEPTVPEKLSGLPFGPFAYDKVPEQEDIIISGATIWTTGPAGTIKDGILLIQGGAVSFAGSLADLAKLNIDLSKFASIDAKGKHITPGIIDCHSHTGISKGVNESGQAVTAEVRIADVTNPDSLSWYRQLAGGVTTINNLHGSANPIGGQNQVNKNRWGSTNPDDLHMAGAIPGIKFALGENVKQSNWGGGGGWRYPQTRMGVEAIIRDRFLAARDYIESFKAYDEQVKRINMLRLAPDEQKRRIAEIPLPRRDLELDALAEILQGKRLVHCHSYRQDEILMLAQVARDFGFKIGTYQHILEGYKVAEAVRESGGGSAFADWWAYKIEVQDAIPQAGPIMYEQGVTVSYNSDSDELARRLNVESAKAVKYSGGTVTPDEALKFVTLNPAKQLRIDSRVGSLEAGKDADFVIWSGDPLSAFSRAEKTYIDGRCYFSLERDTALRESNAKERQRIIQKILGEAKKKKNKDDKKDEKKDDDKKPDAPKPEKPSSLLSRMLGDSVAARRERFLDRLRRGVDPVSPRSGDCGCEELLWR